MYIKGVNPIKSGHVKGDWDADEYRAGIRRLSQARTEVEA